MFYWRLTRDDSIRHGFDIKFVNAGSSESADPTSSGLHINPLEFLAALLNLWISIWIVEHSETLDGGHVLQLNSDNTTALSWMSVAARTPDPTLQGLARIGSALLVRAARLLTKTRTISRMPSAVQTFRLKHSKTRWSPLFANGPNCRHVADAYFLPACCASLHQ